MIRWEDAMAATATWVTNRAREASTYVGAVVTAVGVAQFPPLPNPAWDAWVHVVQEYAKFGGVALVVMSTKHP